MNNNNIRRNVWDAKTTVKIAVKHKDDVLKFVWLYDCWTRKSIQQTDKLLGWTRHVFSILSFTKKKCNENDNNKTCNTTERISVVK